MLSTTSTATAARELEVLLVRAARRGWLDVDELLDAYAQLRPALHPALDDPRRIDIEAALGALLLLPLDAWDAPRWLVVPQLAAYAHTPAASQGLTAGWLSDGTLVIECAWGWQSLLSLAAALCVLRHEADKVVQLGDGLPESLDDDGDEGFDDDSDTDSDDATPEVSADADADADPDADGSGAPLAAPSSDVDEARRAFVWGTDPSTLAQAAAISEGRLAARLLDSSLPSIDLHAELDPAARARAGQSRGQQIVGALAEQGLAHRPLHLWIGPSTPVDLLSPYTRELRGPLLDWASQHRDFLPEELRAGVASSGEDFLYALAREFLRDDPELLRERLEAERSVGIQRRLIGGFAVATLDTQRLDLGVADTRLADWQPPDQAVFLCLEPDAPDSTAEAVGAVLAALGPQLVSLTTILEGTLLGSGPGALLLPKLLVSWSGRLATLPEVSLQAADVQAHADGPVRQGALLVAPAPGLVSIDDLAQAQLRFGVAGVVNAGFDLAEVIQEAATSQAISPRVDISWAALCPLGDAPLSTFGARSAHGVSRLRQLGAIRPPPEPPSEPPPSSRQRRPGARTVRIKA